VIQQDKKNDDWAITCDRCSSGAARLPMHLYDTFRAVVDRLKAMGWRIVRLSNGAFEHRCTDCAKDIHNNGRQRGLL